MKRLLKATLIIALMLGALFTFSACGKKSSNSIVGNWEYEGSKYSSLKYVYTFNEDGTGKYDAAGVTMEFTYELKDGNKIAILYKGNTDPFETEYSIDGDKLNIKDSSNNDTIYNRAK